jgi:hypothetical protein
MRKLLLFFDGVHVTLRRTLMVAIACGVASLAAAQPRFGLPSGPDLPPTCSTADVFIKTGANDGLYYCKSPGNQEPWAAVGGSGGGGTPGGSGIDGAIQVNHPDGTFYGDAGLTYNATHHALGSVVASALPSPQSFDCPNAAATALTGVSTTGYPASGLLRISGTLTGDPVFTETVSYSGVTANTFTGVARGLQGTSATDFSMAGACFLVAQTFAVYGAGTVPAMTITNNADFDDAGDSRICFNCQKSLLLGFGYTLEFHDELNNQGANAAFLGFGQASSMDIYRSNGTPAAPATLLMNDLIGSHQFLGMNAAGTAFHHGASFNAYVDGTVGGRPPARLEFWVSDVDSFPAHKTIFYSDGRALFPGSLSATGDATVSALSNPAAPSVANQGTPGMTSYSYKVVAITTANHTAASSAGTTTTGNATLNGTDFNRVTWTRIAGAQTYDVYRTAGGATQGLIATGIVNPTLDDTGLAGDSASAPATNTTGVFKGAGYQSSDGSPGVTVTSCTSFKNGLCVAGT